MAEIPNSNKYTNATGRQNSKTSQQNQYRKNNQEGPSSQSDSGGCFIATAVYGAYDDPYVLTLRQFRDTCLKSCVVGRGVIKVYYKFSPPIANWLTKQIRLKYVIRAVLSLFVKALRKVWGF